MKTRWMWWVALFAASMGWSALAAAEAGFVPLPEGGRAVCEFDDVRRCDGGGADSCRSDEYCGYLRSGDQICLSRATLVCCSRDADCPYYEAGPMGLVPTECVGSDVTTEEGVSVGLCVLPERSYCHDAAGAVTVRTIRRCHTPTDGGSLVLWAEGDCDRDGISNGAEEAGGTDPCVKPPLRGYWNGEACVPEATGCQAGVPCEGGYECVASDGGTVCETEGLEAYCELPSAPCLEAEETAVEDGGVTYCVPSECSDTADLLDCLVDPESREIVGYDFGDCDGDGVPNGAESLEGTDPCSPDTGVEDAGAPQDDAGSAPPDASSGFDAGTEPGPGPNLEPRFEGGGGCACRATPGHAPSSLGWMALALLGLALVSRRR
ncbi:MAG: hypothetical protein EVA89_32105 [Sandaracinaceae bacterium]|nr:MAG: hypothetical protein EVA89_32105 [Sandaracinaceae bacterium]